METLETWVYKKITSFKFSLKPIHDLKFGAKNQMANSDSGDTVNNT